jgi:hypothetical protein
VIIIEKRMRDVNDDVFLLGILSLFMLELAS